MPRLPILDLYVLSLLERGLQSLYELQKQGGLSLGASTPALRRLVKAGLVVQEVPEKTGNRVRFHLRLTASGRSEARTGWRGWINPQALPMDTDALLRLVDMSVQYGKGIQKEVAQFCTLAADMRERQAKVAGERSIPALPNPLNYPALHAVYEAERHACEAKVLRRIALDLGEAQKATPHPSTRSTTSAKKPRSRSAKAR